MARIDISGLNKAEVLNKLYTASKPLGLGRLHFVPGPLSSQQAQDLIAEHYENRNGRESIYFDYLVGRVMKVELAGDVLETRNYDYDNGPGAAAKALGLPEIAE